MSWAPEVIVDGSGKWVGNALRFETKDESDRYVLDLACRWALVRNRRSVESADPVNYSYFGGKLEDA